MQTLRPGIDYLPDNFEDPPSQPKPIWLQMTLFAAIYMGLQWLWSQAQQTVVERVAIADCTVRPAVWLINHITAQLGAVANGFSIAAPGGGINIKSGCDGFEVLFLLAAALMVAPIHWKWRLAGLAASAPLVWLLNQLRIVALFYAYRSDKGLFTLLHGSVAPLVFIVIATAIFTWFVSRVASSAQEPSAHA